MKDKVLHIPKEGDDPHYGNNRYELWTFSLVFKLLKRNAFHIREVDRHVDHDGYVDPEANHREVKEEHDSVRVLPELPEEVQLIDQENSNSHPA